MVTALIFVLGMFVLAILAGASSNIGPSQQPSPTQHPRADGRQLPAVGTRVADFNSEVRRPPLPAIQHSRLHLVDRSSTQVRAHTKDSLHHAL